MRFVGQIPSKKGIFYGIELDEAKGKNNGAVKKIQYFKCSKNKGIFVKEDGILATNTKNNKTAPRVTVGDIVKCKREKCNGTIRYIGTPYSFKHMGVFYGIELEKPKGNNNGSVRNRWYFACKNKYGCFLMADGLTVSKKARKSKKSTTKQIKIEYKVGDKVMVKPDRRGQIKWIGQEKEFGDGTFYGIRLTEQKGDNDGEWKGQRFFQCPEGFGVYVPLQLIVKPVDGDFDFMNVCLLCVLSTIM